MQRLYRAAVVVCRAVCAQISLLSIKPSLDAALSHRMRSRFNVKVGIFVLFRVRNALLVLSQPFCARFQPPLGAVRRCGNSCPRRLRTNFPTIGADALDGRCAREIEAPPLSHHYRAQAREKDSMCRHAAAGPGHDTNFHTFALPCGREALWPVSISLGSLALCPLSHCHVVRRSTKNLTFDARPGHTACGLGTTWSQAEAFKQEWRRRGFTGWSLSWRAAEALRLHKNPHLDGLASSGAMQEAS